MPILRYDNAPELDLSGTRIRGLAAPSRGAHETLMYRVVLAPGDELPRHEHDHEELLHVLSGFLTAHLDGEAVDLAEGDTVVIPPGVPHHSIGGPDGAQVLPSRPPGPA